MIDTQWLEQNEAGGSCAACMFPTYGSTTEQRLFAFISILAAPPSMEFAVESNTPAYIRLCEDCVVRLTALLESTKHIESGIRRVA